MSSPREDETSYDPRLPERAERERKADLEPTLPPLPPLPNRRRGIGVGLAVSALLAALVARQWLGDLKTPTDPLGRARVLLSKRDWPGVAEALEPLRAEGSLGEEARTLDDAARSMARLEQARSEGAWIEAYDAALLLERLWREPGALRAEIERELDRARSEVLSGQKLAEGRELAASGRLPEALAAFAEVPAGTACAEAARGEAAKARAALSAASLDAARSAAAEGRWEEAEKALAGTDPADPDARALREEAARARSREKALAEAEALLAALRVEEAAQRLESVPEEGPWAPRRKALAGRLEASRRLARTVSEARERFDRGDGEAALSLLGPGAPADLRKGISDTLAAYQGILDALDRADDLAALARARALADLPLSEGNWYLGKAREALPSLERKAAARAERLVEEGVSAFRERRYRQARGAFDQAALAAPGHPVVEVYLARLAEVGQDLYRDGYVLKAADREAARARFEEALACLPPDHPVAKKAREALSFP